MNPSKSLLCQVRLLRQFLARVAESIPALFTLHIRRTVAGQGRADDSGLWRLGACPLFVPSADTSGGSRPAIFDSPSDQALLAGGGHLGALFFLSDDLSVVIASLLLCLSRIHGSNFTHHQESPGAAGVRGSRRGSGMGAPVTHGWLRQSSKESLPNCSRASQSSDK